MEQMLVIREILISYYKKYEVYIQMLLKFLLGVLIYSFISNIGFASPVFDIITVSGLKIPYILFMGFLFALLPIEFTYVLIIFNITIQFSSKIEVAAIVFMVMMLVFCFYAHLGTKESGLIIGLFFAYYFKMPYIVPIFAGLYLGLTSVVPLAVGTVLWYLMPLAKTLAQTAETAGFSITEMPGTFSDIYVTTANYLDAANEIGVMACVLILVFFVVYIVARLDIDYKKETAILTGAACSIIFSIAAMIFTGFSTNIISLFIFSILSGLIVLVMKFFDNILDYQRVEKVEFEDEDYFYYVKMVPKITKLGKKQKTVGRVKRVSRKNENTGRSRENNTVDYNGNRYYDQDTEYSNDSYEDSYDNDPYYDEYEDEYEDDYYEYDEYSEYPEENGYRDNDPEN